MTQLGSQASALLARMRQLKYIYPYARGSANLLWPLTLLNRRFRNGYSYGRHYSEALRPSREPAISNSLEQYFDEHLTGPGLWKWRHYFPIYERHFASFRGREVHIAEIGIYSGGGLEMWRFYFGDKAHIYGIDIEPSCRTYESSGTRIFIGDQSDPNFWREFVQEVPQLDVIIDDGGHQTSQQIATLEALLPHLRPGGVYLCEDVHGRFNALHDYINGFSRNLHKYTTDTNGLLALNDFRRVVDSIHLYPFVAVIETRSELLDRLSAPMRGTEWQPFLHTAKLDRTIAPPSIADR